MPRLRMHWVRCMGEVKEFLKMRKKTFDLCMQAAVRGLGKYVGTVAGSKIKEKGTPRWTFTQEC